MVYIRKLVKELCILLHVEELYELNFDYFWSPKFNSHKVEPVTIQ